MQFGKLHGKPMNRFSPGQDGEKNPMVSRLRDFAIKPVFQHPQIRLDDMLFYVLQ